MLPIFLHFLPFCNTLFLRRIPKLTQWEKDHLWQGLGLIALVIVVLVIIMYQRHRLALRSKAQAVDKLIDKSAAQDPIWKEKDLKEIAKFAFLKMQEAWEKADVEIAAPLLSENLYHTYAKSIARHAPRNKASFKLKTSIETLEVVGMEDRKDDSKDKFTAHIRGTLTTQKEENEAFEELYQFVRFENRWILYNIKSQMDYHWIVELKIVKE
jgi:hypothetical protein